MRRSAVEVAGSVIGSIRTRSPCSTRKATGTIFTPQPAPPPNGSAEAAAFGLRSLPPEAMAKLILEIGMSVVPSPVEMGVPTTVLASTISRTFAIEAPRSSETF